MPPALASRAGGASPVSTRSCRAIGRSLERARLDLIDLEQRRRQRVLRALERRLIVLPLLSGALEALAFLAEGCPRLLEIERRRGERRLRAGEAVLELREPLLELRSLLQLRFELGALRGRLRVTLGELVLQASDLRAGRLELLRRAIRARGVGLRLAARLVALFRADREILQHDAGRLVAFGERARVGRLELGFTLGQALGRGLLGLGEACGCVVRGFGEPRAPGALGVREASGGSALDLGEARGGVLLGLLEPLPSGALAIGELRLRAELGLGEACGRVLLGFGQARAEGAL